MTTCKNDATRGAEVRIKTTGGVKFRKRLGGGELFSLLNLRRRSGCMLIPNVGVTPRHGLH